MLVPEDLRYSKEHEWVRASGDEAVIGITDHAQDKLGDIVFVELPAPNNSFKQMEEFGVVESVKTVSTLYCPVAGKVLEVNKSLVSTPELINGDPYGKGWIMKVKMENPRDLDKLLNPGEYRTHSGE